MREKQKRVVFYWCRLYTQIMWKRRRCPEWPRFRRKTREKKRNRRGRRRTVCAPAEAAALNQKPTQKRHSIEEKQRTTLYMMMTNGLTPGTSEQFQEDTQLLRPELIVQSSQLSEKCTSGTQNRDWNFSFLEKVHHAVAVITQNLITVTG